MGRTIVITGANRGLGYELARQLSESAVVIGTARNPSNAQKLRELKNVHVVGMDVASEESIKAAAEEIKKLAPDGINELWNNAARNGVKGPVTEEIDPKEWLAEFQTNVIGQSIVTRLLLPLLRKSQNAKVIFMSSGCGSVTERTGDDTLVVYSCTKAALDMTVKYWHTALKKENIAVTAMDPGWVLTDMGGPEAQIEPEVSIKGMIKVVEELKPSSEPKLRTYDGSVHAW
ncbi:hypothetical protein, variant 2 [Exophiala xenobiotica]|uniref:NAD(P)-binding protein n=1 Tax=Exophiala xenobiotica TaxID=348802 RepID=A0A0D2CPG2_9EURO|nr:hypothetical protein, variant 2 [Exophiala xenobiotica]XP_013312437.1 hypothetical protein, variant 1 [Exophiala xenobiotica]XP_013312438.1 uncharacterized protein PV05_10537 [Exophiala xenobiotica]KIW51852.1 hypothetical protein PV05_10537 [Exophiala xenobiotica]KIW51853.1 hypothetical protein, variant 1 [Exophiala xenobiotica]KIW51854.1 hypothetical protein, variant 2 [Exophiala xenobiotica]